MKKKSLRLYFKTILFFLFCSFSTVYAQTDDKPFVVVLDAGHGGKDSGNRGNGYYEKNIALKVTLAIGEILRKEQGMQVIYTRKDDRFIELKNRAKIANQEDANLFISIHCDSFNSPKAYGAGTFVLGLHRTSDNFRIAKKENSVIFLEDNYESTYDGFDPNNPESVISLVLMQETYLGQSIEAADYIQKSFVKNLSRKDRTVKQAGFLVLRETYMPSVLVELGFLTNKKEGAYLNSSKGQKEMAKTIAKAIIDYSNYLKASTLIPVTQIPVPVEEKPKISTTSETEKTMEEELVYKVQIAAGSKPVDLIKTNFKGLEPISKTKKDNLYRYFYGSAKRYKKAQKLKAKAIKSGYKHAFIVAFFNGEKITVKEAISRE